MSSVSSSDVADAPGLRILCVSDVFKPMVGGSFQVFRCRTFERRLPLPPGKLRAVLNLIFNRFWVRPRALANVRAILTRTRAQVVCLNNVPSTYWLGDALRRHAPQLDDPALAATMGRNGLARSAEVSWKNQAQLFLERCGNAASSF